MDLVDARPVWSMSGSEQLTTLDALHDEITRLETYRLQLIAGLDGTGHAKELGARDTAELLARRHRLNPTDVRRDLKLATALPKYQLVSAALPSLTDDDSDDDADAPDGAGDTAGPGGDGSGDEAGESAGGDDGGDAPVLLHLGQARAIVSALEKVPATVPVEDLTVAEEQMVTAGRHLDPAGLHTLGRQVRELLDTDGPEPAEDRAYAREAFWLKNADHGVKFGGYLANENAELLHTLIHANAKPHKTVDGQQDPRSRDKRQADALTTVLNAAASTGDTGHGPIKPHLTVTIDYTDLKNAVTSNGLGGLGGLGGLDGVGGLGGLGGFGDLVYGDGLSAAAVRRLACDAGVLPIVLGSNSEPLDVGMEERFVNRAMRRALNFRDKGCVVCGAPPIMCDAHHLVHWIDGGPTAIWNLVLLCKAHHIDTHHGHWTITITRGRVQVSRPTWADPGPTRRLNRRRPATPTDRPDRPDPPDRPDGADAADGPDADAASVGGQPPAPARAWPHTSDIPWITPDEAARLNPWGDEPPQTPVRTVTRPLTDNTWVSPWADDHDTGSPGP